MGYSEILDTHNWVPVRTVSLPPYHDYPKYYKQIKQFKCSRCICKAFNSNLLSNVPTKFDIFLGSPILTCEEAHNNSIVEDIIT